MSERELTMFHHWLGATDAIAATRAEDEAAFRAAMRQLEKAGDLPHTAYTGDRVSLIDHAQDLRRTNDWTARRSGLVRMLGFCAGCHQVNHVPKPATTSTGEEALLHAALWQDQTAWDATCTAVHGLRCRTATTWLARQELLVTGAE
jgi:mono/diheme cytochrome c family protein